MTRQEHWDIYKAHWETAMAALHTCVSFRACAVDARTDLKWQEYKDEMRIANKHAGIARRMRGPLNMEGRRET